MNIRFCLFRKLFAHIPVIDRSRVLICIHEAARRDIFVLREYCCYIHNVALLARGSFASQRLLGLSSISEQWSTSFVLQTSQMTRNRFLLYPV